MIYNQVESASQEDLKALQAVRLKDTCQRVYSLTSFYKDKFNKLNFTPNDIQTIEDIQKLPFTKKQDLRDHYPFGLFTVPMSEVVRVHSSSGTTGKPTVVGYNQNDMDVWDEVMARAYTMAGATKKDVVHNSYGYGLFTGGLGFHNGAQKIKATVVPSSGGFTDRQVMLMKDFSATIIASTPSFALHMAESAKKIGLDPKKDFELNTGIFGAEPTSKGLKKELANIWGIDYHEIYGLSEIIGPGVSCSCKNSDLLHINEDHFYPEIIDSKTGKVLLDGERGELVITSLTKQALPIIRYKTGDITSLTREPCKCGRTLVRMESIVGRCDDMMIINGVNVYPSQVEHVISQTEGLTLNYQIVLSKKGHLDKIDILVEISDKIMIDSISEIENIKKIIQKNILNSLYINACVKLVEPRSIERSMGKAIRIVDKRKD